MNFGDVRQSFPMIRHLDALNQVYLDSAATAQKPQAVLNAVDHYYRHENSSQRRGLSQLSYASELLFEQARGKVAQFINASRSNEIIFTKNATEALNLVAFGFAAHQLKASDEIVLTQLEHHSNLVPWQIVAKRRGAKLKFVKVDRHGFIDDHHFASLLSKRTKIVTVSHLSNVFGSRTDLKTLIKTAHQYGAIVVVDGAQAIAHFPVDVAKLDADFYAFSGHKMYAPNGVGVLYGKAKLIPQMQPIQFGGGMIENVDNFETSFAPPPHRFEAGSFDIAAVIGLQAAIQYIQSISFEQIAKHERSLIEYAHESVSKIEGVELFCPKSFADHFGALSFNLKNIHPHDVAAVIDSHGVTVRAGHHCAMPLMHHLGLPGTVRLSFGIYNNLADVDQVVLAVKDAARRLK